MAITRRKYYNRLEDNRRTIKGLEAARYPALYKFLTDRRGAMRGRLLSLLAIAEDIEHQERGEWGYWFYMPLSVFAADGRLGRSKPTVQKTIALFCAMGLLERHIPSTEDTGLTPYRARALEAAQEQGKRATAFFCIPAYNNRQLHYIERKAAAWMQSGASLTGFSKSTMIDAFGSTTANRVYQDKRCKPRAQREAEKVLSLVILQQIHGQRYTTKGAVLQAAQAAGVRDAGKTWDRGKAVVLEAAGAVYHAPSREDKQRHKLEGGGWIITEKTQ